jgi:hypothetical protein
MRLNKDSFIYFYSKYSPSCNTLIPVINQIQQVASIQPVCIDSQDIRSYLHKKQLFKTVPSILLNFPDENKIEIYEGNDVIELLNNVCRLLDKPSVNDILNGTHMRTQQVSNVSVPNMRQTVTPLPSLSKNPSDMAVKIEDPFAEQREMQKMIDTDPGDNFRNMYADRMSKPLEIKKGEGHESLQNSSLKQSPTENEPSISEGKGFTSLSFDNADDDDNSENSLLIRPSEVSKAEMSGSASASSSRELEAKQKRINSAAQDMMRERDEQDQEYNKKR